METSTSQISRRTVVKGAAWSVPVIAAAVAAPMAVASAPINPNEVPSIGKLVESSDGLFPNRYAGSALRPDCNDNTWGEHFTFTMVISYVGGDPGFSMKNAAASGSWTLVAASEKSVTLTFSALVYCNSGIAGADVNFNSPVEAGVDTISVQAWAVNDANTKRFEALVNASGQAVLGPRAV